MPKVGTEANAMRVAIIGSGPAGFYTVSHFLKQKGLAVELDIYDRLPSPFGLVRAGVAPDHQKDKSVIRAYGKSAENPNFQFFGNVEYGSHIMLEDLREHYHQVVFATGAPIDRKLNVPGEDLIGSHSATEFVAWYNGHPDFANLTFDLSQESVAIVGMGNVAMDVARILSKTPEELERTDIADYALEALRGSKIKNLYLLGRRGPAQAAFTPPEIRELGELNATEVTVREDEARLDYASIKFTENNPDKNIQKNIDYITEYAGREIKDKKKLLTIRFLVSPIELIGQGGKLHSVKLVKNEAYLYDDGSVRARPTERIEELPVGLLFRSVGYRGLPLPGIPFHEDWGTIDNLQGRVCSNRGDILQGLYTAGWIKRGPTGVIGTNKTCAQETVGCMLEDLHAGKLLSSDVSSREDLTAFIRSRQPQLVTYEDWKKIDSAEISKGEAENRPRVKFTSVGEMLSFLKG